MPRERKKRKRKKRRKKKKIEGKKVCIYTGPESFILITQGRN